MDLQDQGVIDSRCSRHMTRNMSYLTEYEKINRGYVAFRGNPKEGKITGKCIIKTANLDFKNVYFMRLLKFNLFSVLQMCDKKNNVLFNDTECIVLSSNFKLTDKSQVLLRVPRKNNMYSVDLKNIVPKRGLTCFYAKNTSDESKLWHRRLGHLNFRTMNKLVKKNLVRGLPSKLFENDQTCVAFQKGKQHRASCKSKTKNSISLSLYLLHIDLFATKDETSGILKSFITRIENLVDHKTEAVNTACYVQNRVLVVKPYNKTPYKLFYGRTLTLSFMRSFGCPVTILNTIDHLGKFPGKADEGFFVGYSSNSKAFRVFNSRTRMIEENLHTRFSESTPNVVGSGPDWLFDINALTRTMNYEPIVAKPKSSDDDGSKPSSDDGRRLMKIQEKKMNLMIKKRKILLASLTMLILIFDFSSDDEDDGAVADMNNLDTTIQVSHIPTTIIHKDHPLDQVIGDLQLATQTRKMSKNLEEHRFYNRFQGGKINKTLFIKRHKGDILLVQVYVDAILFCSTKKELCIAFERLTHEKFQMSYIGEHTFFLDLQVKQKKDGIFFSQDKYVAEILKKFGFIKIQTASISMETQKPLLKDEDVCAYARYQVNPKVSHLYAVKRIFRLTKTLCRDERTCISMLMLQPAGYRKCANTSVESKGAGMVPYHRYSNSTPPIGNSAFKRFSYDTPVFSINSAFNNTLNMELMFPTIILVQHRTNVSTVMVDAYSAVEEPRLKWTRNNQDTMRVDLYHNDAMALCRTYGNPGLFITFTSNPKWPEISEMLAYIPEQKAHD
uniref:Uncharacterized protein n=1 Tax=Tanacetum cinerariifolium TaxID=118510 RepID=A0A6L2L1M1_TANCI|nr:hypothetical protein [Tanacetum cinerariifolium]